MKKRKTIDCSKMSDIDLLRELWKYSNMIINNTGYIEFKGSRKFVEDLVKKLYVALDDAEMIKHRYDDEE